MQELLQQVLVHLRGMWHRRWVGLAVAWIVAIAGVAIVYRIPERFEASARVYVDTESLLQPLLRGLAIQPNIDQQVSLMSRTLISRPNVEKLIRIADLDLRANTPAERDELADRVIKDIKLEGAPRSNLYVISYRDADPARSRKVVQSLLTIFVESGLGDKRQDTQTAVRFLDDQIRRYEEQLTLAENRIKDFKIRYVGVTSREGQDYFGRMSQIAGEIEAARLALQSAEQARDSYKRQLAGETPTLISDLAPGPSQEATLEIDGRLAALKKDLDTLLRKYTDQHPDVVATRRLVAQLEDQRRAEVEARRKAAEATPNRTTNSIDQNPVFQQLRLSLAAADAQVASSRAKLAGLEDQLRALKAQAQLIPQVEAEYAQLNRDYAMQKKTYENLLLRRDAASMGKDVQETGGAQFRIIDPPRVSPQPVAPNRIALLGIACVFSLGAGLMASFLASELRPIFHDARTLREATRRPILGMISMLPSEALMRARRRGAYLFAGGVSSFLVAFTAVFAFALLLGGRVS